MSCGVIIVLSVIIRRNDSALPKNHPPLQIAFLMRCSSDVFPTLPKRMSLRTVDQMLETLPQLWPYLFITIKCPKAFATYCNRQIYLGLYQSDRKRLKTFNL